MAHSEPTAAELFKIGGLASDERTSPPSPAVQDSIHELNNVFTALRIHTALPGGDDAGPSQLSWAAVREAVRQGQAALGRLQRLILGGEGPGAAASPVHAHAPLGCAGLRVLLVEDHEGVRGSLAELLQGWGCVVTMAGSIREADELLPKGSQHVALIDVHLEGDSGMGLSLRLRRAQPGCRIVLISGAPMLPEARAIADLSLEKPIGPLELQGALAALFPD